VAKMSQSRVTYAVPAPGGFVTMFRILAMVILAAVYTPSPTFAVDQHALDAQMTRVIQLEALDNWCAAQHAIDYDALRDALASEREKALAMTDDERELRLSYDRARTISLLALTEPIFFCERMYRSKEIIRIHNRKACQRLSGRPRASA
jgi:hypothetical protein